MKKKSMLLIAAAMLMAVPAFAEDAPADFKEPVFTAGKNFDAKRHDEMKKKFEEKLNLTDEQKEQAKKIHEKGMNEIKPIMEEMKALREKAEAVRKANMEEFKAILTPEQLKILESMPKHRKDQKPGHDKKVKHEQKDKK